MATIKKEKKIKDYDTRSCSEMVIFLSLRKQGCKSTSYVIYTLYYTQKQVILKELQNFLGINTTIFANLILSKSI
ncbi:hypothetical protein CTI18_10095 [Prevotella intermedia]|uniref:Uncharacterized protein n=1 Tax=Prevotella intermedia TaxID=28131 RepID=A0A2G8I728_PREIN|nr:hypothetical protein CTI18_10095 [Prevotella intermedia]